MDNDDRPVGRILTRREVLAIFGGAGAMLLAGCSFGDDEDPTVAVTGSATSALDVTTPPTPEAAATEEASAALTEPAASTSPTDPVETTSTSAPTMAATTTLPACIVSPELTEGPYFVDEQLDRSDIREDPSDGSVVEGVPLELVLRVSQINSAGCTPLADAQVDVWHCDALGVYSGVSDPGFNTAGRQFLRGYQLTDADGVARFITIYPGWYQGRAVHIHFKVRSSAGADQSYEFTSQFFFDDELSDSVFTQEPYASKGERTTFNSNDGIFQDGGDQLLLTLSQTPDGFSTTFDIGLQLPG
jgi:protocatechuate 3,4-dioxygenase beta subunit